MGVLPAHAEYPYPPVDGATHERVQEMLALEHQGIAAHQPLELGEGDHRAREGDCAMIVKKWVYSRLMQNIPTRPSMAPPMRAFRKCWPLNTRGLPLISPWSL